MTSTPPRPKLGKIWNVYYFDIVAPPLTLAKTVPKSYQIDTWGLFYSYIGHIVPDVAYISQISVPFVIKINVIFQLFESGKNLKNSDPPPQSKWVYIWNVHFLTLALTPPPPFWTFSTTWTPSEKSDLLPMFSAKSRHSTPNLHTQRDCPTITYEFRGGQNSKKLTKSGLPKGSSGRKSLHFHQLYD